MFRKIGKLSLANTTVIGILLLITLLITLFGGLPEYLTEYIPLINSDGSGKSNDRLSMIATVRAADQIEDRIFPLQVGIWERTVDISPGEESLIKDMKVDFLNSRDYQYIDMGQLITLHVIQGVFLSYTNTYLKFYQAKGYKIQALQTDYLESRDIRWNKSYPDLFLMTHTPVERFLITMQGEDEKVVSILNFKGINENTDRHEPVTTMVMCQMKAAKNNEFEDILTLSDDFLLNYLPQICEVAEVDNTRKVGPYLIKHGALGYVVITTLILFPLCIITVPLLIRRRIDADEGA